MLTDLAGNHFHTRGYFISYLPTTIIWLSRYHHIRSTTTNDIENAGASCFALTTHTSYQYIAQVLSPGFQSLFSSPPPHFLPSTTRPSCNALLGKTNFPPTILFCYPTYRNGKHIICGWINSRKNDDDAENGKKNNKIKPGSPSKAPHPDKSGSCLSSNNPTHPPKERT